MIARELINRLIPALQGRDNTAKATAIMDDLMASQLPVVDDGVFRGYITNDMLFDNFLNYATVGEYLLRDVECAVRHDQHFYEIVKILSDCDQSMVVVLDDQEKFMGVIDLASLTTFFAGTAAVQSPGGIIELSLKQIDYSLTEITRLIESDGVKVMGCFLRNEPTDPTKIRVTLKLDRKDVTRTVATLERFNYHVQALFQEELVDSHEKERLDALLKYLNV